MSDAYARAGVDRDAGNEARERIARLARSTFTPGVVGDIGYFGALFRVEGFRDPLLVSHADGVGTKTRIAVLMDRYDTVGRDLVAHCVNDILVCGARPLFLLDYIGTGRLVPGRVEALVRGIVEACREVGCALIGGETAEMPGIYQGMDFDLVGFIVGAVERDALIDGRTIREGDAILGLPSSGLHTNGYSLVRRVFRVEEDPGVLGRHFPELGRTLGEELLEPHRCYYNDLAPLLPHIKGMAHITGGGLLENIPRTLPEGLCARLWKGSWEVPPIFPLVQRLGQVEEGEMYRVFNMGLGMVLFVAPEEVAEVQARLPQARVVGEVVRQAGPRRVVLG